MCVQEISVIHDINENSVADPFVAPHASHVDGACLHKRSQITTILNVRVCAQVLKMKKYTASGADYVFLTTLI